jgi:hypothetical protein
MRLSAQTAESDQKNGAISKSLLKKIKVTAFNDEMRYKSEHMLEIILGDIYQWKETV